MRMPTDGLSAFGAVPGIVELHSTPLPLGPAEDDDCKSSIPGCRCSATIAGIACGRANACTNRGRGRVPCGHPGRHGDADRRFMMAWRMPTDGLSAFGAVPGIVELHSTPPPVRPAEDDDCKSSIPGFRCSATISGIACGLAGRANACTNRGAGSGTLRAPESAWGCRPTVDDGMRMPTDGLSAFGAVPGIVELHSTPLPLGPAEDDDCKSSIPGCRCSATISGIACGLAGRANACTNRGRGRVPCGHPSRHEDADRRDR
jgi:hypothetical protein